MTAGRIDDFLREGYIAMGDWLLKAACGTENPNLFLSGVYEDEVKAARICACCTVRTDCLDHAMANAEPFFRAGMTQSQRRELERRAS